MPTTSPDGAAADRSAAPAPGTAGPRRGTLWAPERRALTTAVLLLVTLMAFESLGVNTAMPTLVSELHGTALYAWPFVAFLAASVVATVVSGHHAREIGRAHV